jgi:hypothetical protein
MKKLTVVTGVLATFVLSSLTVLAQTPSREDLLKQIEAKRIELDALEKSFFSPSEDDRIQHAQFLQTPNTGLMILLPREKFDGEVYKDSARKPIVRGGGAYYSFTRKTNEYGYGADLLLERGRLSVGFYGTDYGLLTELGDLPLEKLALETPAAALFAAYKPPIDEPLIRKEAARIGQGAELEGLPVRSNVPLKANSTYLLRSIHYSDSDVLVAFRVVRIDTDGSAIILWKLLTKFETPKFNRSTVAAG